MATQWEIHQSPRNSAGAQWDRSANAFVAHCFFTEILRHSSQSHCVYAALISSAQRVIHLTVLQWILQGVLTSIKALTWSIYHVCKVFSRVHCAHVELLPRPVAFCFNMYDHGGDSIDTTCAVVWDVTAYIAVVRVFRFSSEYYGCRYHRCPYFSAHRANRSSLISAFITENCQEGIYRHYKRLSSFLNIKTITRIYF